MPQLQLDILRVIRRASVVDSAINFAIILTDLHGFVTDWSAGAENILGWTSDDMLGEDVNRIFTPEDREQKRAQYEMTTAVKEGRSTDERWHMRSDGTQFWASGEMMPLLSIENEHEGYVKILRDRTAEHESGLALEEALEAEEQSRAVLDSIEVGFCILEVIFDNGVPVDYLFLETNAAFERQVGPVGARGRTVLSVNPHIERHWISTFGMVALSGKSLRFENFSQSSGERWFEVYALPVGKKESHRIAALFTDVTKRKQRELASHGLIEERTRERDTAEEHLRQSQKMEAVGQLTGGIAHDFNNLLSTIMGSLEMINKRIQQGRVDDVKRYVSMAESATQRAAALTHRLLAFSRRQTLAPKPTDINKLVHGLFEMVERTVGPTVELSVMCDPDLWSVCVDGNQLENAFLNLCINARDAMPDGGGSICISTKNKTFTEADSNFIDMEIGDYVLFCVEDTGSGMPPEVLEKAFEPFFTTKPVGEGTGLGLSMIYGFARQSGGYAHIHSEVGKGTTVCLHLPRNINQQAEVKVIEPNVQLTQVRHAKTVLVVDDEPMVRMLVVDTLEECGYTVIEADAGKSGLELLQSDSTIDLLVTDVGLPGGMTGRQMVEIGLRHRPDLKVLYITGYAETDAFNDGHFSENIQIIAKPFALDVLTATIQGMIESQ